MREVSYTCSADLHHMVFAYYCFDISARLLQWEGQSKIPFSLVPTYARRLKSFEIMLAQKYRKVLSATLCHMDVTIRGAPVLKRACSPAMAAMIFVQILQVENISQWLELFWTYTQMCIGCVAKCYHLHMWPSF